MPTVTVLGFICRDRNVLPDGTVAEYVGGKGLFTGAALSRLGIDTNLITWLPEADRELLRALDGYPVTIEVIAIPSGTVNTNSHSGDSTLATTIMDPYVIVPESLTGPMRAMISQSDIVHLAPDLGGKISLAAIQFMHEELGARLGLDAGKYFRELTPDHQLRPRADWPDQEKVLPFINTLFLSEEDVAAQVETGASLEMIASKLSQHGPQEVIITRGSKGSLLYEGTTKQTHLIPAFPPKVFKDPTGAGDTFIGSYLAFRVKGKMPTEAARLAAMTASAKLAYQGPLREAADEIERKIKESAQE